MKAKKKNILVVEDEQIIALDIQQTLKTLGYMVPDICLSGEEAISMIKKNGVPDLILMDITLSGEMDGITTVEKISEKCSVPVIYVTSNSDSSVIEQAKQTYPSAFLTKPFNDNQLSSAIEIALFNFIEAQKEKEKLYKENEMNQMQIKELMQTQQHLVTATWRERELKQELQQSKAIIEKQNKKISDSINYAKRIQKAIVPNNELIREVFPESFIYYLPKDVVSGDFPWFHKRGDDIYIAAVDCTGHGVPGAMLSLIANFQLDEITGHREILSPAVVLDRLHTNVRKTLKQDREGAKARDGMDIALCKINLEKMEVEFAGAHNPLYHVRDGKLTQYKGDRKAIGGRILPRRKNKKEKPFTNHTLKIEKGDTIYFFSDGMPDQMGGPEGLKYSPKRIREKVTIHHPGEMKEIRRILKEDFMEWMQGEDQLDDVLLIGIRF